jgi:sec-independent protein translocase protein TatC
MAFKRKSTKNGEGEMSFLEHLEELRWHIIRSIVAIVVLMIVAFIFKQFIFDHTDPLRTR